MHNDTNNLLATVHSRFHCVGIPHGITTICAYLCTHKHSHTALWGAHVVPTQWPFKRTWQFGHAPTNQLAQCLAKWSETYESEFSGSAHVSVCVIACVSTCVWGNRDRGALCEKVSSKQTETWTDPEFTPSQQYVSATQVTVRTTQTHQFKHWL